MNLCRHQIFSGRLETITIDNVCRKCSRSEMYLFLSKLGLNQISAKTREGGGKNLSIDLMLSVHWVGKDGYP